LKFQESSCARTLKRLENFKIKSLKILNEVSLQQITKDYDNYGLMQHEMVDDDSDSCLEYSNEDNSNDSDFEILLYCCKITFCWYFDLN